MVISVNPIPEKSLFQKLLDDTLSTLQIEAKNKEGEYLSLIGRKLENVVADIMKANAIGTPFQDSIELISGQKFPDIIAKKYYGLEIKTSQQNHWTSTGNSVLEGTRVDGIERIFMLFGKMISPVEFKCRPYEDCLSEVVVTHSPRYLINMELATGETIFNKLEIPYEVLRNDPNPIKHIAKYYRKKLKPGEEVWWLDQEDSKAFPIIIRLWNNLSNEEKKEFMLKMMVLFPEIFGNKQDKFNRASVWLVNSHSIVCPNIRDIFTAGGQGTVTWKGKKYGGIPQVVMKLSDYSSEINAMLSNINSEELQQCWGKNIADRVMTWIDSVVDSLSYQRFTFNIKNYLIDKINNKKPSC